MSLVVSLLLALAAAGCVRGLGEGPAAPAGIATGDPRLAGVWVSARDSQVGPAGLRLLFDCDGGYRARVRVFGGTLRLRERGVYWTEDGVLHFTRATGETTRWRYRFDGEGLELEESPRAWNRYRRAETLACSAPVAESLPRASETS